MERDEWRCPKSAAIGAARVSRPRLGRPQSVLGLVAWAWLGTSLAEAQSPAGALSGGSPVLLALSAGFVFAVLVLAVILFVLAREVVRRRRVERTLRDVTARVRAQEEIRRRSEVQEALLASMPALVFVKDASLVYVSVNQTTADTLGCPVEEIVGRTDFDLYSQDVAERVRGVDQALLAGKEGQVNFEQRMTLADGSVRWLSASKVALHDPDGKPSGIIGVSVDITARRQAETDRTHLQAQMLQAQKIESLGVLAGGIAHDFNNLLMAILGNADLALREISPASPARESLEEIVLASRRAADLCRQMLAYSGKGRFVIQALDLRQVVEEMQHLLEISISKKAILKYVFPKTLPAVEADATQIRQVIMNLVINASEAIGERSGIVSIAAGVMDCDSAYLAETYLDENLAEGRYAYLEVADTGCGMDRETRARVFDPFFSTKFTGRGLGMAAVLGIVRGHRGAIKVYSEPGRGTTFKVLFPAIEEPADAHSLRAAAAALDANGSSLHRLSGTVLVVDDEESVRKVATRMLEKAGLTVLTAQDGREALAAFQNHGDRIGLVLLDLTMPHMDGIETFRELRRARKDVRVVVSSGYNRQEATQQFAGKGLAGFIQKPYKAEDLLECVREAWDGDSPADAPCPDSAE